MSVVRDSIIEALRLRDKATSLAELAPLEKRVGDGIDSIQLVELRAADIADLCGLAGQPGTDEVVDAFRKGCAHRTGTVNVAVRDVLHVLEVTKPAA